KCGHAAKQRTPLTGKTVRFRHGTLLCACVIEREMEEMCHAAARRQAAMQSPPLLVASRRGGFRGERRDNLLRRDIAIALVDPVPQLRRRDARVRLEAQR